MSQLAWKPVLRTLRFREEADLSGVHVVQTADDPDLAVVFHLLQQGTVAADVVDGQADILLCHHVHELIVSAGLFAVVRGEVFDRQPSACFIQAVNNW